MYYCIIIAGLNVNYMQENNWVMVCIMREDYSIFQQIIPIKKNEISIKCLLEIIKQKNPDIDIEKMAVSSYGQRVKLSDMIIQQSRVELSQPLQITPMQQRRRRLLKKKNR